LDVIHDLCCGWHADIFHAQGGSTKAAHEQSLIRIPRWRQIRFWREKRYREQAEIERRQHCRQGALIVAVSEMDKGNFHALHGVPIEKIRVIYNGVDTDRFSPQNFGGLRSSARRLLGCSDNETVFLSVGYDLGRKNAGTAIRALSRVVSDGSAARLVILGGKRPGPCARLASKLGQSDRVTLVESVEDVRPYYAAADAYVHPSWYDPCSIASLEALACGLPVITTRVNGVSELMADGDQGFLVPDPGDHVALAEGMAALLDPELRSRMGAAARRLAEQNTTERQTGEFLALYREIAARKNRSVMPEEAQ